MLLQKPPQVPLESTHRGLIELLLFHPLFKNSGGQRFGAERPGPSQGGGCEEILLRTQRFNDVHPLLEPLGGLAKFSYALTPLGVCH